MPSFQSLRFQGGTSNHHHHHFRRSFLLWATVVGLLCLKAPECQGFLSASRKHQYFHSTTSTIGAATTTSTELAMGRNDQLVQHVVIAGAGVVGTSTAYYLARDHGIRTTLVDVTGRIAPAASGKAGGFLALDWNDYGPTGPLTRRSFALHQELADEFGADDIQYRRLECASIVVAPLSKTNTKPGGKKLQGVEWAEEASARGVRPLGTRETIAQVHPKLLCERLWKQTQQLVPESKLVQGKVVATQHDPDSGNVVGANVENSNKSDDDDDSATKLIPADAVLYACGPWTNQLYGVKYHSIVAPTDRVLEQCVFFSGLGDPEVYVRPDQTAYCTGFPDPPTLVTERPGEEEVRSETVDAIVSAVTRAARDESISFDGDGVLQQACYLPSTADGVPIMGPVGSGVYVAAGHSCWGILMGPATGEAMAHLIATQTAPPHVDLRSFDPARLPGLTFQQQTA